MKYNSRIFSTLAGGFKLEIFIFSQKGLENTTCGLGLASFIVVTSIFEIEVFETKWYF